MIHNILEIILLFIPLTAIFLFPSALEGLLKITLYVGIFHLILSILTQILHIFNYSIVLTLNILFVVGLFIFLFVKRKKENLAEVSTVSILKDVFKNNFIFFIVIILIFSHLFLIRRSYNGIEQTINGPQMVSNQSFTYPFISDEWVIISEIKYSINNHALPIVNSLYHNIPFPNIPFAFSSLLAEFFLLAGLNPLMQYWMVSIFFALSLCSSLYILLKKYKVNNSIAATSLLIIPYIVNSGNLPALWSLLPFTLGIIFFIWQLISQKFGYINYAILFAVLALVLYPPMVVFVIPVLCFRLYSYIKNTKGNMLKLLIPLGLCVAAFLFIFCVVLSHFNMTMIEVFEKYIIRPNLDNGIVSYGIWNVLPIFVLPFALIGLFKITKDKYYDLFFVFIIGLGYWVVYDFLNKVFIIEYPRIVFLTSLFVIVIAAIGFEYFVLFLIKKINHQELIKSILNSLAILFMVISILFLPSYSSRTLWQKLTLNLTDQEGNNIAVTPAAPVNRYLTEDDLNLFQNIHGVNFIAPPWKGLVIGVATDNFALETKSSSITNRFFSYYDFMSLVDCRDKDKIVQQYNISYVYSTPFSCPNFEMLGSSSEGLFLYKAKTE